MIDNSEALLDEPAAAAARPCLAAASSGAAPCDPRTTDITAASRETLDQVMHSLDKLQRLAELLAVDDGYQPPERTLQVPPNFMLSVLIPVYNEERTIRSVVAQVAALPIRKEIIIIDDASTDDTRQLLGAYEAATNIHVIFKPRNEGKGAALRTGLRRVTGDVVVVQDADLEYDPRDILTVVRPILSGQADVVYGSRFLGEPSGDRSRLHRLGNRLLTTLSNWATGLDLTDMETCYKAFRREVIQSFEIEQPRFGFEPEITARVARGKYRLCEVPISYRPRGYAEGKKIGLCDLVSTLYCIVRYKWL